VPKKLLNLTVKLLYMRQFDRYDFGMFLALLRQIIEDREPVPAEPYWCVAPYYYVASTFLLVMTENT